MGYSTGDKLTLSEIGRRAYETAKRAGFCVLPDGDERIIPESIALIHSEASEALEEYRTCEAGEIAKQVTSPEGKPLGFGSELADLIIRTAHLAERLGIDLNAEVERKLEYNRTRKWPKGIRC